MMLRWIGPALGVAVAITGCLSRARAAEEPSFVSHPIFDPSISDVPQSASRQATTMSGLVISPTFDSSITSDPKAATIMNTINTAIAVYRTRFSDPITVSIKFQKMTSGLGSSSTYYGTISYTSYLAALSNHATTADDAIALAHLPVGPNNPVNGNANMAVTTANLRALGFAATPPGPDSTISLNTSICNLDRSSIDPTKYDLLAVVWHEIDESLGFGSALNGFANGAPAPTGPVWGEDLFRYDQTGNRSLSTTRTSQAFFSIDGTTHLARFNQTAGADFQDWFTAAPHTPQVQDAVATAGATPDLGVELTALDVIGFTLVEPPGTPTVTATGAVPTGTPTPTNSATQAPTNTSLPTNTATNSPLQPTTSPTSSPTGTPTSTPTATPTPTRGSADLHGSVTLQGRPAPPDPRWSVPLVVSLTPQGAGPTVTCTPTTDQDGNFTCGGFAPASYVACVKNTQTLQNCEAVTLVAGDNTVNFGTLRAGDANDDNCVLLVDFSILAATFSKCTGDAEFDARADFDGSGCVVLADFSLLATNFTQCGATP
jgi:hypothetical protein